MSDVVDFKVENRNGKWYVVSEKTGKNLGGPYRSKAEAVKRLRQVEWYKKHKKKNHHEDAKKALKEIVENVDKNKK